MLCHFSLGDHMSKARFQLFLTGFFLLLPMLAWAQMPPVTDADLKFNAVPGQPGAPAAILYREEIYDDVHNHSASYQQRIKILTEEGRKYADIVIPYDRKNLPIIGLSGRTIHPDGK